MTRTKSTFLALIAVLLSPMAANADIIDFEGVIPAGQGRTGDPIFPYTEDGFLLSDVDSGVSNALFGPLSPQNHNGTDILGWVRGSAFSIASLSATPFSLFSLDLSTLSGEASNTYTLTGFLSGGGTIGAVLTATNVWSTFSLGWSNLDSVTIRADVLDGALDNIVVNVPEPGTLALLGIGLAGMGLARRRRKV